MVVFVGSPPPAGVAGETEDWVYGAEPTGGQTGVQLAGRSSQMVEHKWRKRGVLAHIDQEDDQAGRGDPYITDMVTGETT